MSQKDMQNCTPTVEEAGRPEKLVAYVIRNEDGTLANKHLWRKDEADEYVKASLERGRKCKAERVEVTV